MFHGLIMTNFFRTQDLGRGPYHMSGRDILSSILWLIHLNRKNDRKIITFQDLWIQPLGPVLQQH
jgi:hypothetical protein